MKSYKVLHVYNLTDDDMKIIKYQVHDVVEEAMEEETQKQDEQHKKVRDKFILIQKLLEIV